MSMLLDTYRKEKGFVWTGKAGIVLGLICFVIYLIQGNEIPPEGEWTKAITFNLAIGIFSLTTAVLLPFVEMKPKQRKWFCYPLISSFWIAYGIETIQNARGFDPRFTEAGLVSDQLIGLVFGIVSMIIIVSLLYFMVLVFKKKDGQHPLLLLSLRYACLSIMLAFLSGIWMVILQGRVTNNAVDIMVLHFVGFHGYQAIPMIGWLISKGKLSPAVSKRTIHIGGGAWLAFCLFLFVQIALGNSVYQTSVILIWAGFAFGTWCLITMYSFKQFIQTARVRGEKHNV